MSALLNTRIDRAAARHPEIRIRQFSFIATQAQTYRHPRYLKGNCMRLLRYTIRSFLAVACLMLIGGYMFLQHDKFGSLPSGTRLSRLEQSPNYTAGRFHNRAPISAIVKGGQSIPILLRYFTTPRTNPVPPVPVPAVKTDLKALDKKTDILVWIGHSSYFLQLSGKTILIDPVFSAYASPVFFSTRAFPGTNPYTAEDMPPIDYLLISHDHWDHLDYATVMALKDKVRTVVTGLGVGAHFEHWGFPEAMLHEADWGTALHVADNLTIHVETAQHYSGRLFDRNRSLWASFVLETPEHRLFFSGDSGYGPHFAELGERYDGFDLVMLDSGQYNKDWQHVHMTPEQAVRAAEDLHARAAIPSHSGKFSLAFHAWDDPFKRFVAAGKDKPYRLVTPKVGEAVRLGDREQTFSRWWEALAAAPSSTGTTVSEK